MLSLYQQQLEGYSALTAGLSALPLAVVLVAVAGAAGPLTERIGPKPVLLSGLSLFTAGDAWLSRIPLHGSYAADLLGPDVIMGLGLGLTFVAITIASTLGVANDRAGLAGGLINTTQQIGGAPSASRSSPPSQRPTQPSPSPPPPSTADSEPACSLPQVSARRRRSLLCGSPGVKTPTADPVAAEVETVRQVTAPVRTPAPAVAG